MSRHQHISFGEEEAHKAALERGLAKMVPGFLANICWWCGGTGRRKFEYCDVCATAGYGTSTGMVMGIGFKAPAPWSVVNQVLEAGKEATS